MCVHLVQFHTGEVERATRACEAQVCAGCQKVVCILLDAISYVTHTCRMYSTGCYIICELSLSLLFSYVFYWML